MTQYHVDAEQVAAASASAQRSGETIRTEVSALLQQLNALDGSWQGNAALAFASVLDQWRAAQVQVDMALESLSVALNQAADHYSQAEDAAARLFSGR